MKKEKKRWKRNRLKIWMIRTLQEVPREDSGADTARIPKTAAAEWKLSEVSIMTMKSAKSAAIVPGKTVCNSA